MNEALQTRRNERVVARPNDGRTPAERDRDRVLYAPAFRRLAGVTQVVGLGETQLFHNRLTHSLKVAQVARRIAEQLVRNNPDGAEAAGGIDPDCVEVAALAHDLGHPPFGHVAEEELQRLLARDEFTGLDSFEGNAQSFRIITKLSVRTYREEERGLNLTRASLRACSKYPWFRGEHPDPYKANKWGAYRSERQELAFALDGDGPVESAEAKLMDWADDIAYAVHDIEDFFRVGVIPLDRIALQEAASRPFLVRATARLAAKGMDPDHCRLAFDGPDGIRLSGLLPVEPYSGSLRDQALLQSFGSGLISRYVNAVTLHDNGHLEFNPMLTNELAMLKQLTWHFVIDDPALATMQHGQCAVIAGLFEQLNEWALTVRGRPGDRFRLPTQLREFLDLARNDHDTVAAVDGNDDLLVARAVVDYIASLTEDQAVSLFQRLTGGAPASALDAWVRL